MLFSSKLIVLRECSNISTDFLHIIVPTINLTKRGQDVPNSVTCLKSDKGFRLYTSGFPVLVVVFELNYMAVKW